VDLGANYLIAGAIYETPSHPYTEVHGLGFLEAVCRRVEVPVIAIGGIGLARAKDCLAVGASGVAVLSSILYANDPRRTAVEYRRVLDRRESDL
jgi:thiamine monophosphate synthase